MHPSMHTYTCTHNTHVCACAYKRNEPLGLLIRAVSAYATSRVCVCVLVLSQRGFGKRRGSQTFRQFLSERQQVGIFLKVGRFRNVGMCVAGHVPDGATDAAIGGKVTKTRTTTTFVLGSPLTH